MERANPANPVLAPAHRLGPGEARQDVAEDRDEHLTRRLADSQVARDVDLALPVVPFLQHVVVDAEGADETVERLAGRSNPRSALLDLNIGLPGGQTMRHQSESARGGIGRDLLERQLGLAQGLAQQLPKIVGRALLQASRNLL